jgi:hypothetical protein
MIEKNPHLRAGFSVNGAALCAVLCIKRTRKKVATCYSRQYVPLLVTHPRMDTTSTVASITHRTRAAIVTFLIGSALLLALGASTIAHAQTSAGLDLKPGLINGGQVEPGGQITRTLTVENPTSDEQTLYLSTRNVVDVRDGGKPVFADPQQETTKYEISSWITLSSDQVTVPANGSADVQVSIAVPEDAGPGGHFGAVFLRREPPEMRQIGAGVGYEVASLVTTRVAGDVVEDARLGEFTAGSLVFSEPRVTFSATVENDGNVLLRPSGILEIRGMSGDKVASIKVNEQGKAGVFPEASRTFETTWEADDFAIGRYQALISFAYGDNGSKTISDSFSFWVIPMSVIAPALIGLLVLILVIFVIVRVYTKKKLRELKETAGIDPDAQMKRGGSPGLGKLMSIAIALLLATLILLAILFIMFA